MNTKLLSPILCVALLSVFAGCEKDPSGGSNNPNFDKATNTVRTEFVLNVSTNTGKDTKTTAKMAQITEDDTHPAEFLGMDQVHLLAYELDNNNYSDEHGHFFFNPIVGENPVAATRDYNLGTLFPAKAVTVDQSSRVVELSLPLRTNAVAFYGKAIKTYDDDLQGITTAEGNPLNLTTLKFSLTPRLTDEDKFDVGAFFFSRLFTYICCAGAVNQKAKSAGGFWVEATGSMDKRYAFWWCDQAIGTTPSGLPDDPIDGQTAIVDGKEYTFHRGNLSWKNLGYMYYYTADGIEGTDPNKLFKSEDGVTYYQTSPLGDALGDAYYTLTTIKHSLDDKYHELRAGSASAVLRTVEDLHSIVERVLTSEPTTWYDKAAQLVAEDLEERIHEFFQEDQGSLYYLKEASGKYDVSTLKTKIEKSTSPTDWASIKTKVAACSEDELRAYFPNVPAAYGFPVNVGLPFGASIITCNAQMTVQDQFDRFEYVKDIPAYGFDQATFPIKNYRYPPELMYYGNSAIRTNKLAKSADDYPSSVTAWATESLWSDWAKFAPVTSDTRSVAMVNNINYGTALLCSHVNYATGVTVLKDNNAALHPGEQDRDVSINAGSGLLVTGIIIGGQADVMGWDYTRRPNGGAYNGMTYSATDKKFSGTAFDENPFDKIIYDRVVDGYTIGQSTTPIYSFVWDNYDHTKAADEQSDVYVGIEIYNNTGEDFWGEMNLIRNKGVFYLLGKLDLSTALATAQSTNATAFTDLSRANYCYPPYNPATGETINAPRVFMQDYMTTANLVLGQNCLKHAYVTLPDLRSSQVSLGVSIDMSWTPGLAFTVTMGDN